MKILWVSRHTPLASQLAELRRLFGDDVVVEQDPKPFDSAETIAERYRSGGYDEMLVVAPLSVCARLIDLGIRPLWAEMEPVQDPALAETTARGRHYRFGRFRRMKALRLEFEELG